MLSLRNNEEHSGPMRAGVGLGPVVHHGKQGRINNIGFDKMGAGMGFCPLCQTADAVVESCKATIHKLHLHTRSNLASSTASNPKNKGLFRYPILLHV